MNDEAISEAAATESTPGIDDATETVAERAQRLLLPFNGDGNLPIGTADPADSTTNTQVVLVGLDVVYVRFVESFPNSQSRESIWNGWMAHRAAIEALGLNYSTYVDGSFVTATEHPNDIDLLYFLNPYELDQLSPAQRVGLSYLLDKDHTKPKYRCDVQTVFITPPGHSGFALTIAALSYWTRLFSSDRLGRPKGLLHVCERGIL